MLTPTKPEDFQPITEDQRIYIVVPYRALHDKRFTIQRMRALLTICSYANHQGNAWPSIERMAEDMGISKPTMQAHIKWLTDRKYLITVNNSYTVGKHAKPRAIVYDPKNPPHPDDWQVAQDDAEEAKQVQESITKERDVLVKANQSGNEELARPASLYQCYRSLILSRFGTDVPYDKPLWVQLSHRYSLEDFKKAAVGMLEGRSSPPANARIMLKFSKSDPFPPAPAA